MKKILGFLLFLFPFMAGAQVPAGYYNNANGLTGAALQNALKSIIENHNNRSYDNLWNDFRKTDKRKDDSTKVWDIYSDKPGQTPAYYFTFNVDQCGSYNSEADCYNREHSYPKSHFSSAYPMYTDLFHMYPTDGYVNNKRGNLPYAKVGTATYTSSNGSKVGNSITAGFSGQAFEPIDSFKGDLARSYFYMLTCYKGNNNFLNWDMTTGTTFKPWASAMLLEWHHLDPVSQKEIDRNEAIYSIQGNRNPFIDHPEWADCIWGNNNCGTTSIGEVKRSEMINVYPNPAKDKVTLELVHPMHVVDVTILSVDGSSKTPQTMGYITRSIAVSLEHIPAGLYFLKIRTDSGIWVKKLVKE